jgi:hypothetical protein
LNREQTVSIVWNTEALTSPPLAEIDLLESVLAQIVRDMQAFDEGDED